MKVETSNNSLKTYNLILGVLHAVIAISLIFYFRRINDKNVGKDIKGIDFRLFKEAYKSKGGKDDDVKKLDVITELVRTPTIVQVQMLMVAFFVITSIFHFIYYSDVYSLYSKAVSNSNNYMRWIEYSITATIMIAIIALTSGIKNFYLLVAILSINIAIMLQGDQIEKILSLKGKSIGNWIGPMFIGFMLLCLEFWIIGAIFNDTIKFVKDNFETEIPRWLFLVIYMMGFFFLLFGLISLAQAIWGGPYVKYEKSYLLLSLISKASLGIFVAYGFGQRLTI